MFGFLEFWIFGFLDFWRYLSFGLLDFWSFGFLDFWIFRFYIFLIFSSIGSELDCLSISRPRLPVWLVHPICPIPAYLHAILTWFAKSLQLTNSCNFIIYGDPKGIPAMNNVHVAIAGFRPLGPLGVPIKSLGPLRGFPAINIVHVTSAGFRPHGAPRGSH